MNEAVQNSKNIYTIEYQLQVPVSDGLSALFQQIEELRSEFGIEPSDNCIDVEIPCQNKYTLIPQHYYKIFFLST